MRRDLATIAGLALVELLLVLFAAPDWVRAPFLVPLVLILPGYAVAARLFAPGTLGTAERGVYTVVFSIAITALSGVLLQLVLGVDRDAWALTLCGVTIVLACVGLPRRARLPRSWALPRAYPVAIGLLLAAAGISAVAIVSASEGVGKADAKIRFTDLWMLPAQGGSGGTERVRIGVQSHEDTQTAYQLRLLRGPRTVVATRLALGPGQSWERTFAVAPGIAGVGLKAELLRGSETYRYVDLAPSP